MAQFLGGGLAFDSDTDATECLLLLELANESDFPLFAWRCPQYIGGGGDGGGVGRGGLEEAVGGREGGGAEEGRGGAVEIPGSSRRCLALRVPRLSVGPEGKVSVLFQREGDNLTGIGGGPR